MERSDKFSFIWSASKRSLSGLDIISEAQEEIWAEEINVELAGIYTVTEALGEKRTPRMKSLGKPVFKSQVEAGESAKEAKESGQSSSRKGEWALGGKGGKR